MAPFKSSLSKSVGKLIGSFRERDKSLRGFTQSGRGPVKVSASGGSTYTPGNGYKYHVFKHPNSDNFVVTEGGNVEVLVVAGGGAAGKSVYGGGGGGGGVIHDTTFPVVGGTTYPVTVGDGGDNPDTGSEAAGNKGADSYFGPPSAPQGLTGKGGGGGGSYQGVAATPGGSGGGDGAPETDNPLAGGEATQPEVAKPATATNYGNDGAPAVSGAVANAGGGGAGAAGQSAASPAGDNLGGQGGDGQPFPQFAYPLIGLSPLDPHSPTNDHFGGGGSGWGYDPTSPHSPGTRGGYGGGGRGSSFPGGPDPKPPNILGLAGANHLGGGGGGAYPEAGKDGGSGIVIVRYEV